VAHRLGVSGSVILSDPERFAELFWEGVQHIEIGEFSGESALNSFLRLCADRNVRFGIHSPLFRGQSKYDLIEKVEFEPEDAWVQLEMEAERMSALGAQYILVHFPYFKRSTAGDTNEIIEKALNRLSEIQTKYAIPIVCEPKLGLGRSPAGIRYLDRVPVELWDRYGLKLCIDIGDYAMAVGGRITEYLAKWKAYIHVVHLHNVEFADDRYIWVPVHLEQERDGVHYRMEGIIRFLAEQCRDVTFVFEHTPHTNPSKAMVQEGYRWVQSLVQSGEDTI
jgi:sugar phosphate isomerase/epimerase